MLNLPDLNDTGYRITAHSKPKRENGRKITTTTSPLFSAIFLLLSDHFPLLSRLTRMIEQHNHTHSEEFLFKYWRGRRGRIISLPFPSKIASKRKNTLIILNWFEFRVISFDQQSSNFAPARTFFPLPFPASPGKFFQSPKFST